MQIEQQARKRALRLAGALLSIAFLCAAGWSPPADDPSHWSTAEWTTWRDQQIKRILTPTWPDGDRKVLGREEVILRSVDAYKTIAPLLDDPNFMPAGSDRENLLGNFVRFVTAEARMATYDGNRRYTHLLGYPFSDKEYWTKASAEAQIPSLFKDRKFLDAMASPSGYAQAGQMIREQNESLPDDRKWIVMSYRSQFLKSAEGATYGRLLVLIPNQPDALGGLEDQWFQFATECPNEPPKKPVSSISEVSVHRSKTGQGKATAFLVDFLRQSDSAGQTTIVPTMLAEKSPSKHCYDCHKSPVLPIHPKAIYEGDQALLASINDRIESYGRCGIGYEDSEAFGPPIGQPQYKPPLESLKQAGLDDESAKRVREAMKCSECHSDTKKINYPAAVDSNVGLMVFEAKKGLAQTYIESGWMPPGNTLSQAERKALWQGLAKQYFDPEDQSGALIDWLRGADHPQ